MVFAASSIVYMVFFFNMPCINCLDNVGFKTIKINLWYLSAGAMPPCLGKFDKKFRDCMAQKKITPENFFKLLANVSDGTGMTLGQLKNNTCR